MVVDVDIAFGLHGEIEQPMFRKQGQHVIEKRHSGVDLRGAATVNRERDRDVGFRGFRAFGVLLIYLIIFSTV